jgi:hypothetical protein
MRSRAADRSIATCPFRKPESENQRKRGVRAHLRSLSELGKTGGGHLLNAPTLSQRKPIRFKNMDCLLNGR